MGRLGSGPRVGPGGLLPGGIFGRGLSPGELSPRGLSPRIFNLPRRGQQNANIYILPFSRPLQISACDFSESYAFKFLSPRRKRALRNDDLFFSLFVCSSVASAA